MKLVPFIVLLLAFAIGACAPSQPAGMDGEQPTPIVTSEPASVSLDVQATTGYQPVNVVDVYVEVGQGSPIPVFVDIGADLPDRCAQVEFVEVIQDGTTFNVYVGTLPSTDESCMVDTVPFRMKVPLNVVGLPAGSYSVHVNDISADFQLDIDSSAGELPTQEMPITKDDIQVDDVSIVVGRGSPLPVHAIVSANLPNTCSQLGEVQMRQEGNTFYVRLTAYTPAQTDCNPDALPIRVEIPLNLIPLSEGPYEVIVNGTTTDFELPIQ